MSNNGKLHIGAIACKELVTQPWELIDQFPVELEAMRKAVLGD